jgi:hypothetical protein
MKFGERLMQIIAQTGPFFPDNFNAKIWTTSRGAAATLAVE